MKPLVPSLAALLLSAGLALPAAAQTITIGLSLPENIEGFDFVNGMYRTFAEEVEANSDMSVNIVYGGALGNPNDRLAQMRRGVIEMTDAADGNYASIFSDIMVLNMPYLFPSEQVAWQVFDGPFGTQMAEDIREATGIRVLGWWESGGFKHFSASRLIESPADMEGLKMRVLGPLATIPVEAMGASASPVAFGELYTALSTGVVDGQDNSVSTFNLIRLYEVQSHLMMTGHVYAFGPLGISDAFFSGLSPENQQVILDAAAVAIAYNRETSRAVEASAITRAEEAGVTVVRMTDAQRDAFRQVMQPAAIEWLQGNVDHPDLIDAALAAVAAAQ
ncbi:TRAP transporter substrate-binding protein [Pararhodobacter sp.]|uniref:TRAP transporter substrate-binding protein n=1 Tax=Pararhodobacter sp. TaxID=2127056 RepID=UPI002AFE5066|nr:TRAP transporter substrate-binding protein [Pararhodobacter sp.]